MQELHYEEEKVEQQGTQNECFLQDMLDKPVLNSAAHCSCFYTAQATKEKTILKRCRNYIMKNKKWNSKEIKTNVFYKTCSTNLCSIALHTVLVFI